MDASLLLIRNLKLCSGIAAFFVFCLGFFTMTGWLFNIPELLSVMPGLPTMKFNTGLCFALSGLSLWLLFQQDASPSQSISASEIAVLLFAALVVVLASATLSQYLFDWNSGLDEFFISAEITDSAAPGRMSVITAVNFILIGTSLMLVYWQKLWTLIAQLLALLVTIISSLALLSYLFQADLNQVDWFSSIALHSAFSFWIVGLGVLGLRADQGFMQVYTEDTNSARQGKWFLLSALLIMPLIAELRIIGQRDFGMYDTYFGISILTVASITALTFINWFRTRHGNEVDIEIHNMNRIYALLSGINTLIVRTKSRDELFLEACNLAVKTGNFTWAWIITVTPDNKQKKLEASEGGNRQLLDRLQLLLDSSSNSLSEDSLLDITILSKKPAILNDIIRSQKAFNRFPYFHTDLLKHGIQSLVMLPLMVEGRVVGVFALHADRPDFFDKKEMNLLIEMAGDIAFATKTIAKDEQLNYLAYYDPLTELANRTYFFTLLDKALKAAAKANEKVSLIILDIRRFRSINESLGRTLGDEVLKKVANRLYINAPQPETLARLNGGCFAMFHVNSRQSREHQGLYRHLQDSICEPLSAGEQSITLQISMGIAIYPGDGENVELLLNNAEAALEKAKEAGQLFTFYETKINDKVAESFVLENKLRRAIEHEQFVLHYQPKIEFGHQDFYEVEALIRWQDPDTDRLVPPGMFIPLLEQTGLIRDVGKWAMNQALTDMRRWKELKLTPPRVAVNVSAIQLRDKGFIGSVVNLLTEFEDLEPLLDLELTESMIMENVQRASITFKTLMTLGVGISIDDFGTGHSSLAYLARLPISTLKIDRSFVLGLTEDDGGITLVSAIISLAHSLKLKVIAEGVETEEQARLLQEMHCDMMQGYLFCKPVPFDELAARLTKANRTQ